MQGLVYRVCIGCMAGVTFRPLYFYRQRTIFCLQTKKASKEMSSLRKSIQQGFLGRAIAVIGAASSAAAAVEGHRRPKDHHLKTLGINPAAFPRY